MCGICGKYSKNFLCKKCENILKKQESFITEDVLDKNFDKIIYFFRYEGLIRKIILKYKFSDQSYIYKTISFFMLKNNQFVDFIQNYDTIVPVPISKKRYKERGYNQSYLIAKEISKKANLNLQNNCLIKSKNIIEQSKLNKEERMQNIQGVYKIKNKEKIYGKKVILIDDIYTTGSTADECCKTLKQANPKKIAVLTIAKD